LLTHYEKPGMSPPSARMRAVILHEQHRAQRVQVSNLCRALKLGKFLASTATEIALDVLIHHLFGPRRKSWGLRMTLLSSVMRDVGNHSSLVDIATIRLFLSIGELGPLPDDAVITPVTFRVHCRHLRGILAAHDAREDGTRELTGEWVTTKESMRQARDPDCKQGCGADRVVLYLHGGAYYLFSPATHRRITIPLSRATDARVFAVDYRLAPESRFPGPLHDAASAYFRLVDELGVRPENIIVAGDSAGGGLALALLMYLRDDGYPLPAGAILMSPWVDLTLSCDSWDRNSRYDIVPRPVPGDLLDPVVCYLGVEHVDALVTHPYASPLFGEFRGLPPLLLQSGEVEVLRDEHVLLAAKARRAGVHVVQETYDDAIHVFQAFWFHNATERAFASCGTFTRKTLPQIEELA
ncbi:Alpha/Beta hydrolase protein, partial [Vararia minispora EC-137]